ncbi:MAG: hypothetical protein LH471_11385, partial [Salinibacterium sp.]|nr:hypothetical protein [Salinibacterium sp.]
MALVERSVNADLRDHQLLRTAPREASIDDFDVTKGWQHGRVMSALAPPSRARRAVIGRGITLALVASLGLATVSAAPAALANEVICTGDTCDDGIWQLA